MREIKFRAWDTELNRMFGGSSFGVHGNGGGVYAYSDEWTNQLLSNGLVAGGVHKKKILMQFTGLQDKNGKDIYEGDIIHWDEKHTGGIEEVKWFNQDGAWSCVGADKDDCGSWLGGNEHICEVIGNIHENPELLKEGE